MSKDSIVEEVRRIRQRYAEHFNFDLDAIYADLKECERRGEFTVVYRRPRPPRITTRTAAQQRIGHRLTERLQATPGKRRA